MAAKTKSIRKKFFEVKLPLTATKVFLYGISEEALEGSVIKLDLTRSLKGKSLELKARVKKDSSLSLIGEPISLELVGSYIRKMVRKGTDYVEDSFDAECKDAILKIKPFLITRKKVSRAIRNELRMLAKKTLESHMKIRTSSEIFSEVTSNKIQKELFLKLKKVYPLALCEIRVIEILKTKQ